MAHFAVQLGSLIEVVNRFGSIFYGSLLGVFVLALGFRRANGHRCVRRPDRPGSSPSWLSRSIRARAASPTLAQPDGRSRGRGRGLAASAATRPPAAELAGLAPTRTADSAESQPVSSFTSVARIGWLAATLMAFAPVAPPRYDTVIVGGRIVDGTGRRPAGRTSRSRTAESPRLERLRHPTASAVIDARNSSSRLASSTSIRMPTIWPSTRQRRTLYVWA